MIVNDKFILRLQGALNWQYALSTPNHGVRCAQPYLGVTVTPNGFTVPAVLCSCNIVCVIVFKNIMSVT